MRWIALYCTDVPNKLEPGRVKTQGGVFIVIFCTNKNNKGGVLLHLLHFHYIYTAHVRQKLNFKHNVESGLQLYSRTKHFTN